MLIAISALYSVPSTAELAVKPTKSLLINTIKNKLTGGAASLLNLFFVTDIRTSQALNGYISFCHFPPILAIKHIAYAFLLSGEIGAE